MQSLTLVVLAVVVVVLPPVSSQRIAFPCGSARYTTSCGFWGSQRCSRYRSRTCYKMLPVNGGWTDWEKWQDMDECSVLCGGGSKDQERSRTCTNPSPAYGGADCGGDSYQNQTIGCSTEDCGDLCPEDEPTYLGHDTNEKRFYQCSNGVAYRRQCPEGTVFDSETSVCKHAATTAAPETAQSCSGSGVDMIAHESDCTKFYMCSNGIKYAMVCPATTKFDVALGICIHGTC